MAVSTFEVSFRTGSVLTDDDRDALPPRLILPSENQSTTGDNKSMRNFRTLMSLAVAVVIPATVALAQGNAGQNQRNSVETALRGFEWRSIGPANMGGRITSLAVYEKSPSTWWAATASGGLLKTVNNGVTFEHQFDREATVSIGDVQVSQSNPNIVWVGTGEGNPRNSSSWGDGVYKSTDGGKTWKNMGLKKIFQTGRLSIHPTNPNIVYVGALGRLWGPSEDRGLYKTTDGGKTWKKVLYVDDKTGVIDVQMDPSNPDHLLVATYERQRDGFDGNDPAKKFGPGSGIYRTTDGGKTFARLKEGLPTVKYGRVGLSFYRKNPKLVYAVIETERVGQLPEKFPLAGIRGEDADVGARLVSVTAKSAAAKAGLKQGDIVIAVDGSTIHSYADLQQAIRKGEAGKKAQWTVSRDRESVDVEIVYGAQPKPSAEEQQRLNNMRSNPRSPFSASLGGQVGNLQDQQGSKGYEFGGVYMSEDSGATWRRINSVNPRPMYYSQIRVDPSDNKNIYLLGTSLYRSKDGGKTFTGDGADGSVHVDHHSLWVDPNNSDHLILGNDGGIYVTYDRMENWDHHNHVAIGQFYHVGVGPEMNYRVYGGMQDNGSWGGPSRVRDTSGPMNADWFRVGGGDGFLCIVDPEDKDVVYFESQNGAMGRINLVTGARGFIRPRAPRGTRYRFNWKTPFILSPHNSQIHYSAGNHVFRSVSRGGGVKPISPDITNTDKGAGSAISESAVEQGVLYVGTTDGAVWGTRNGGQDWTPIFHVKKKPAEKSAAKPAAREKAEAKPSPGQQRRSGRNQSRQSSPRESSRSESGKSEEGPGEEDPASKQDDKPAATKSGGKTPPAAPPMPEKVRRKKKGKDPQSGGDSDSGAKVGQEKKAKPKPPEKPEARDDKAAPEAATEKPAADESKPDDKDKKDPSNENAASPLAGKWNVTLLEEGLPESQRSLKIELKVNARNEIGGTYESPRNEGEVKEGKFDPKESSFKFRVETERSSIEFSGTLSKGALAGSIDVNSGSFTTEFSAKKGMEEASAEQAAKGQSLAELVPGPRWVSSLEASKFQAGRCYLTLDGHRSDDDAPYVFVTENYGQSWRSIRSNLPASAGSVRVLREDIKNRNILYLGCEFSIWVSLDRGEKWSKLNANLPTVAVHEIAQHPLRDEIVAGTHGRSLWILDVKTLRQLSTDKLQEAAVLFDPADVIRWRRMPTRGSSGTRQFKGTNPRSTARFQYWLAKNARFVELRVSTLAGDVIFESEGAKTAGMQSVDWNLVRQVRGSTRGRSLAANGEYLVTLTVDDDEFKQTVRIEADPDFGDAVTSETEEAFLEAVFGEGEEEGDDGEEDEGRVD